MELKISEWRSEGLRCPDGVVNLKKNGFKRFNFVQMPNGTGKTTYLELIQAALSGSLEEINVDGKTIGKYYNPTTRASKGSFELHAEWNSKKITFRMDFNFDIEACKNKSEINKSKVKYSTDTAQGGGYNNGYKPPREIRRMLTPAFVKLFVFDGEFATQLFNPGYRTAFNCLDSICQLNILDKFEEALEKYYKANIIKSEQSSAVTPAGVTKAMKEKDNYQKRVDELNKIIYEGEKDLVRITKEIKNIENEINEDTSLGGNLKKVVQEKKELVDALEKEFDKFNQDYFNAIRNPLNLDEKFVSALDELQDNLYKLRIPASATKSFFEELKEEENCICDREMNEDAKKSIDNNKEKYFDENRAGIYNKLKTDIREKVKARDFDKDILNKKNEEFLKLVDQQAEAKTNYEVALENLKQSAPTVLANKIAKKELLIKEKDEITKKINEIKNDTETDNKKTKNIKLLNKLIQKQTNIINQIEGNISLRNEIDTIKALCKNIKLDVKKEVKTKVLEDCNSKLSEIFKGVKTIRIEDIEEYISLSQQTGASMGQQLTTGMLYLAILLGRENFNFFTIFDSPCGAIDLHVRNDLSESLSDLIKKDGQFITFVQSAERDNFTETIEKKVKENEISYLTIYDKERFSVDGLPNLPKEKTVETNNGVFVYDKNFFNTFSPTTDLTRVESNV